MAALIDVLTAHHAKKIEAARAEELAAQQAARKRDADRQQAEAEAAQVLSDAFEVDGLDVEAVESRVGGTSFYYIKIHFETGTVSSSDSYALGDMGRLVAANHRWQAAYCTDNSTEFTRTFDHFLDACLFAFIGPNDYPHYNGKIALCS